MLNKAFYNRVVNALALIVFCFMVSTGSILKWILRPGSGRVEKMFSGGRHQKAVELFWGMSRHEWGQIHFYLSAGFLAVLVFHLWLHWNWIRATAWGTRQCPQPWTRKAVTAVIVLLILISIVLPWVFSTEILDASEYLTRYGTAF